MSWGEAAQTFPPVPFMIYCCLTVAWNAGYDQESGYPSVIFHTDRLTGSRVANLLHFFPLPIRLLRIMIDFSPQPLWNKKRMGKTGIPACGGGVK
jgi:hypothetical protein